MFWMNLMISNWRAYLTHYYPITPECHNYFMMHGVVL